MKNKFLSLILVLVTGLMFASCIKDNVIDLEEGDGSSFLKIPQAPENKLFFSPFTDVKTVALLTVRRDVTSNSELNTQMAVKIEVNNDSITSYNTENGTHYDPLPDSLYTLGAGITKAGNIYTLTLAPGEFQKDLNIGLNGAKWDLSKVYALAFKVVDSAGLKISSGNKEVISLLSIKNKWDGVYEVTGTMVDATAPTLGHINTFLNSGTNTTGIAAPMQFELRTISATKCELYDNYFFGGNYMPITSADTYSQFGSFALVVEFDPATDKVVAVTNYYGQPAGNTRSAQLSPDGINAYNASTKTIDIKYHMLQPSVVTVAPHIRVTWDETWKYIGER